MTTWIVTNDDGYHAPGLDALRAAVRAAAPSVRIVVVAPDRERSHCGHSVTAGRALVVSQQGEDRYQVDGTPADCVRVALDRLAPEATWVLSGINAGGNLGSDVYYSGTVAAAREAALHGRSALAVSHYIQRAHTLDWDRAAHWTAEVIRILVGDRVLDPGLFLSVNLPHPPDQIASKPIPELVTCPVDPSPLRLGFEWNEDDTAARYRSDYQGRPRRPDSDIDLCFRGRITVSRITVEPRTDC